MNFVGTREGHEIQVELKYCERCGGLWLRLQGTDGVYCAGCRGYLAARPNPGVAPPRKARRRKRRGRRMEVRGEHIPNSAPIDYVQGVATMEVRG